MAWASPPIPPGSAPRPVMLKDPVPVRVQTTGWPCPSGVYDQPATSPDSLIPEATPVLPPSVPRSVRLAGGSPDHGVGLPVRRHGPAGHVTGRVDGSGGRAGGHAGERPQVGGAEGPRPAAGPDHGLRRPVTGLRRADHLTR